MEGSATTADTENDATAGAVASSRTEQTTARRHGQSQMDREANRFDEETIRRLKADVDIVEVITGAGVVLVRNGGDEFSGCCPFHKDTNPSFTVNQAKGVWHCFGCGRHGDVINFLREHLHEGLGQTVGRLMKSARRQAAAA